MKELEILLKDGRKLYVDSDEIKGDFIGIMAVSEYFRRQTQYISYHFNPLFAKETTQLGNNLRIKGKESDYSSWQFHKEDIPEVIDRLKKHYEKLWGKEDIEERIREYYLYR